MTGASGDSGGLEAETPLRVAVLVSGRGSNMAALASAPYRSYRVANVFSDRPDAGGLARARDMGIPTTVVAARPQQARSDYDQELAAALRATEPGLVVLAGFMRILSPSFVQEFTGRLLNIHPSLLPKYPGLRTHQRVLEAGDREHGCSVHFVTEELDGGPVIAQTRVDMRAGEDAATLQARVLREEHKLYPMTVDWFATGTLEWREGAPWFRGAPLREPILVPPGAATGGNAS
jgi:phosphoribosylglycinamide formyltransferase-1